MNKKAALNMGSALLVVLCIDLLLVFGQSAIHDINPEGNISYITNDKDILKAYYSDVSNSSLNTTLSDKFIGGAAEVTSDSNVFTDTFIAVRNWILAPVAGLKFLVQTLAGPYSYLANPALGLPEWFSLGIGALWFIMTLFLLVAWAAGRS